MSTKVGISANSMKRPCATFLAQIEALGLEPNTLAHDAVRGVILNSKTGKYFDQAYEQALADSQKKGVNFVSAFSRAAGLNVIRADYDHLVPKSGPLVVVANHPFGLADAFSVYEFLDRNRPGEVMAIATGMVLDFMPELAQGMVPIDFSSRLSKVAAAKAMAKNLKEGKVVALFPAGALSQRRSLLDEDSNELLWQVGASDLAVAHKTNILPIHIEESNSRLTDFMFWMGRRFPKMKDIADKAAFAIRPWENTRRAELGFEVKVGKAFSYQVLEEAAFDTTKPKEAQRDELYRRYLELRNSPFSEDE